MTTKEISFLITSDIHENQEICDKFAELMKDSADKYDYQLNCGDIVTLSDADIDRPGTLEKYDPMIKSEISSLGNIKVKEKFFYIPGNHDTRTLYENKKKLVDNADNLHKKYYKLDEKLYLIAVGGGIPILFGKTFDPFMSPFTDLNTKNVLYDGYPYNYPGDVDNYDKSDADFGRDVENLINEVKKIEGDDVSIILLTHLGPISAWTNYELINGNNGYLGSKKLEEIFLKEKGIFLDIHGHTHDSKGLVQIYENKYVINPGDMKNGNYASITIKKNSEGKWGVTSSFFGKIE